MSGRQDKAVASQPARLSRIQAHVALVEQVCGGSKRDCGAGVSIPDSFNGIGSQHLRGCNRAVVEFIPRECHVSTSIGVLFPVRAGSILTGGGRHIA